MSEGELGPQSSSTGTGLPLHEPIASGVPMHHHSHGHADMDLDEGERSPGGTTLLPSAASLLGTFGAAAEPSPSNAASMGSLRLDDKHHGGHLSSSTARAGAASASSTVGSLVRPFGGSIAHDSSVRRPVVAGLRGTQASRSHPASGIMDGSGIVRPPRMDGSGLIAEGIATKPGTHSTSGDEGAHGNVHSDGSQSVG